MKKYIIPVILPYIKQKEDWIFDNQKISEQKEELNKEKLEELIKIALQEQFMQGLKGGM